MPAADAPAGTGPAFDGTVFRRVIGNFTKATQRAGIERHGGRL